MTTEIDLEKRSMLKLAALSAIAGAAGPALAMTPAKTPMKVAYAYVGPVGDGGYSYQHD